MSLAEPLTSTELARPSDNPARLACAAAVALGLVPITLCHFSGTTGTAITANLVDRSASLQLGATVAAVVGALLVLAAVRVGARIAGTAGRVTTAAGVALAVLYAAYYASFGAGAVVAGLLLDDPGAGVGEGTALLVNFAELARYAPTLTLLVAAVIGHRALPRPAWIVAAALAALMLLPFTSWIVALLTPMWLGTVGALRTR